MPCVRQFISFLLHECQPIHLPLFHILKLVMQELGVELNFIFSCLGVPTSLSSLPHAFFRSPFVNLSEVEFSTMLSKIPSVDITRSLNPFCLRLWLPVFLFLDFFTAALSLSMISRFSFSSRGVSMPSMISSYPLSSAITLNFRANSCQLSFVLLNLYTLMLFRPSFSSLIVQ